MGELFGSTFTVRRPVTVIERNDVDGKVTPVALCFVDDQAIERFAKIRVLKCAPAADVQSGAVGERYDCVIMGKRESLYYGLLQPRSWFRNLKPCRKQSITHSIRSRKEIINVINDLH